MPRKPVEYALYKGDELIMVGTIKEIAEEMGVQEHTIRFYQSPSYKRRGKNNRKVLIKIEEDN